MIVASGCPFQLRITGADKIAIYAARAWVAEHYRSRMTLSAPLVAACENVSYAEMMSVSLK